MPSPSFEDWNKMNNFGEAVTDQDTSESSGMWMASNKRHMELEKMGNEKGL